MKTEKLTFTERIIIDIVSKNIVDRGLHDPCYLDTNGGRSDTSVCGVMFGKDKIVFTGPKDIVEKIAKECKQKSELIFRNIYFTSIPLKMFPTLALLAKVVEKAN